jgi:CBS domain-containing protein
MRVDELTSPMDVVAYSGEVLADAASRMRYNDVGCVPVLDGHKLVGILTERDLARAAADGADPRVLEVADYMTPEPTVVAPGTDIREAVRIMVDAGVRHLPVVDRGELRGVMSMRDVISRLDQTNGHEGGEPWKI